MCLAQLHPKGLRLAPQRLIKDCSTFPTYGLRVDLHILHRVLRFPLLRVASFECLSHYHHTSTHKLLGVLYRDLNVVEYWVQEAKLGRFEVDNVAGHIVGLPTYVLVG